MDKENNDQFLCAVKVGHPVPDFSFEVLQSEEIKRVKFSDYRGRWLILFFYPADFTFVCPTELEEMAEHYDEIQKSGGEVISISTDTVFVHKAWHDASPAVSKIRFPMGADPTGKISRAFGVYIESDGVALRGSFIIDPDGKLCAMEINEDGIGRSAKELFRKFQAAQFVTEHGGQVCPASWEPGGETLRPGLDQVGKI